MNKEGQVNLATPQDNQGHGDLERVIVQGMELIREDNQATVQLCQHSIDTAARLAEPLVRGVEALLNAQAQIMLAQAEKTSAEAAQLRTNIQQPQS